MRTNFRLCIYTYSVSSWGTRRCLIRKGSVPNASTTLEIGLTTGEGWGEKADNVLRHHKTVTNLYELTSFPFVFDWFFLSVAVSFPLFGSVGISLDVPSAFLCTPPIYRCLASICHGTVLDNSLVAFSRFPLVPKTYVQSLARYVVRTCQVVFQPFHPKNEAKRNNTLFITTHSKIGFLQSRD